MYNINDFMQRVKNCNGLVCYGVGKRFRIFEQCFQGTEVISKVIFCVDQDETIQNTKIFLEGREVDVLPIEKIKDLKGKNIILIVTNLLYNEILIDLSKKKLLQEIEYYCFSHLYGMVLEENAMTKKIPEDCHITTEPIIPKIIHYCWFGHNPLPDKYKEWMESWHRYCPDYEIREWNEENYDISKNNYMYEAYLNRKWGFVPDYARLDIIYEYGGIYLDTDVELVQGLDDMLYQKGFAGFESKNYVNLGLGFGAVKGLPIIKNMRDVYEGQHFKNIDGSLDLTASPVYQTDFLVQKGLQLNGEYQKIDDLVIYPEKMFSGKCPYTRRVRLLPYTKSIHHFEATWADDEWKKRNKQFESEMNAYGDIGKKSGFENTK